MAKRRKNQKTNAQLRVEIKERMAEINKRAKQYSEEYTSKGKPIPKFVETQNEIFKALTGTKNVRGFATGNLSRFNKQKLLLISNRQELFLKSAYSTKEGREAAHEKRYQSLRANKGIDREDYTHITNFFEQHSDLYYRLKESGTVESDQIVDLIISQKYSGSDIADVFKTMDTYLGNKIDNIRTRDIPDLIADVKKVNQGESVFDKQQNNLKYDENGFEKSIDIIMEKLYEKYKPI